MQWWPSVCGGEVVDDGGAAGSEDLCGVNGWFRLAVAPTVEDQEVKGGVLFDGPPIVVEQCQIWFVGEHLADSGYTLAVAVDRDDMDSWAACFEEPGKSDAEAGAGFADAETGPLSKGVNEAALLDAARQWEVAGLRKVDSVRHPCG